MHEIYNKFDINSFQKSNFVPFAHFFSTCYLERLHWEKVPNVFRMEYNLKLLKLKFIWYHFEFLISGLKKWTPSFGRK